MTLRYPEGIDCVWMAVDKHGNLAAFVTGGEGPIPIDVLTNGFLPIEDIESAICELDVTSEARLLVSLRRPDDYVDMARRGFYVFDWRDVNRISVNRTGVYEKIAIPSKPIKLDTLSSRMRASIESMQRMDVDFDGVLDVDARSDFKCCSIDLYRCSR